MMRVCLVRYRAVAAARRLRTEHDAAAQVQDLCAGELWPDGTSARPLPAHAVAQGDVARADEAKSHRR